MRQLIYGLRGALRGIRFALVVAVAASALQLFARPWLGIGSYEILLTGVAISVLAGGAIHGTITLFICALLEALALRPMYSSAEKGGYALAGFLVFLALGLIICWIGGWLCGPKQTLTAALGGVNE